MVKASAWLSPFLHDSKVFNPGSIFNRWVINLVNLFYGQNIVEYVKGKCLLFRQRLYLV